MKHILPCHRLLVTLFLLTVTTLTWAYYFAVDGIYYQKEGTSSVYVTYGDSQPNSYSGSVTIPSTVTYHGITYDVTGIANFAFIDCYRLTSITIPESVTYIGSEAFGGCKSLVSVIIPNSVTSINVGVFEGCTGLTSITIPNSVTSINGTAFASCTGLTSVTISKRVTSIGPYAFSGCTSLTDVTIPNSVTSIAASAFEDCSNLTSIVIPESVTNIGGGAFYGTAWYNNQPDGLIYAGKVAYKYKGTMPSGTEIVIKDGTLGITENAFYNCSGLKSVVIPNSVTSIGEGAFYRCSSLKSITIPNSVTSINDYAFYNCSGLTSVTIGSGVTSIGYRAFEGCSSLKSVTIPNSVTSIASFAFLNCSGLTSVTIPNSVTSIGQNAFERCSGLTSVTIGNGVTSIGYEAFKGTAWYNNQPDGLVYAGKVAYKYKGTMPSGTEIAIKEGTLEITGYAFENCSGLTSITIPNSVTSIGSDAFCGCKSLTNIYSFAKNPPVIALNPCFNSTAIVYVPHGCKEKYTSATYWKDLNIVEMVDVESVEIAKAQYDIIVGESKAIDVTVLPNTATYQKLEWQIDNPEIATIDKGIVTGKKTGQTKLTVTTTDGTELSASCRISVTNPVQSISLSKTQVELEAGKSETITASCVPADADDVSVLWKSSDNSIATVTDGKIVAVAVGEADIIAKSVNGIEARCRVKVIPTPVTSLSLNKSSIDLVKDASFRLICNVTPENATNKELKWTSLNSDIASVDATGLVTARSTGRTTIVASSVSNSMVTTSCIVNVTTPVTSIRLENDVLDLLVEESVQLSAICLPSDADNPSVGWTTANSEIATVSQDGTVMAKNEGEVRITATTTDGTNLSASCQVYVKRHKQAITWNQEALICQEGGEMIALDAGAGSGLPVKYSSADSEIVSIFDLDDVVYANPVKEGKTVISAYQQGNYKYEPAEAKREIEVIGKPIGGSRTLVAYYSQSKLIDGIVTELTNQIAGANIQVYTQKIESSNSRIDEANHNADVRDSIMNVITLYPDDAESYPSIKPLSASVSDYDAVILVYPIWNAAMAAPMQTFCFQDRDNLRAKSIAFVEYDLFDEAGLSSEAKVLRLSPSNIDDKSDLIRDWLNSEATGILQLMHGNNSSHKEIYDLQGRNLYKPLRKGIYVQGGVKLIKK